MRPWGGEQDVCYKFGQNYYGLMSREERARSEWSGKASRDRAKTRGEDGDDDDDRAKPRVGAFCFLLAES